MASLVSVKFLIRWQEAESMYCVPKSMATFPPLGAILGPVCTEPLLTLICRQTQLIHSKRDSSSAFACMKCKQSGRTGFWTENLNDSNRLLCESSLNPQHWHNRLLSQHITPVQAWRKAKCLTPIRIKMVWSSPPDFIRICIINIQLSLACCSQQVQDLLPWNL